MNIIEVQNVTKSFREGLFRPKKLALRDISLTVQQGDFVLLNGTNGAGKSTLINIILGLFEPDSGSVQLFGFSPKSSKSKLQLGTVFQEVNPPESLTVGELIDLIRSYYKNPIATQEILTVFGLSDKKHVFPKKLSGGQKRLLYCALALIGNPKLLILDEPTENLAQENKDLLLKLIEQYHQEGMSILIVTHDQYVQDRLRIIATHIIKLSDGKLVHEKQPEQPNQIQGQSIAQTSAQPVSSLSILIKQSLSEIIQISRDLVFLGCVFFFSMMPFLILLIVPKSNFLQMLTQFSSGILFFLAVERMGGRIALERSKGWLKLLRVTPLPPLIYITAKVVITIAILIISLFTMFVLGAFKLDIDQSIFEWLFLGSELILSTVPFIIIGIALAYVIPSDQVNPATLLLMIFAAILSGYLPPQSPNFIADIVVLFPFFHYNRIVQFFAGSNDQYLTLHIIWLSFYAVAAGLIAKSAYQKDSL